MELNYKILLFYLKRVIYKYLEIFQNFFKSYFYFDGNKIEFQSYVFFFFVINFVKGVDLVKTNLLILGLKDYFNQSVI